MELLYDAALLAGKLKHELKLKLQRELCMSSAPRRAPGAALRLTCLPHLFASPHPLPSFPPTTAGGFLIESPRDFAARIYSIMGAGAASSSGSGAAASSGGGASSGGASSGAAAAAVDPEVL